MLYLQKGVQVSCFILDISKHAAMYMYMYAFPYCAELQLVHLSTQALFCILCTLT